MFSFECGGQAFEQVFGFYAAGQYCFGQWPGVGFSSPEIEPGEGAGGDAPLGDELVVAFIFGDSFGGLGAEVINAAFADAFEEADAHEPEFHGKVWVGIHAGREFGAIAADKVPHAYVHHIGWPCGAGPVVEGQFFVLLEQFRFFEGGNVCSEMAFDDTVTGGNRFDGGAGNEKIIVTYLVYLFFQVAVPSGAHVHIVIDVKNVFGTHKLAAGIECIADAYVGGAVGDVYIGLGL